MGGRIDDQDNMEQENKMRIEDGIIRQLTEQGYKELNMNVDSMAMYYRMNPAGMEIILILRAISGGEISPEEYKRITGKIKDFFYDKGFSDIHLLGIILTAVPERARFLYYEQDDHFIVDLWNRRLIVYENRSPFFSSLVPVLEDIIHDEEYSTGLSQAEYTGRSGQNGHIKIVSLINSIIIAVNILIYILFHYTGIFGETIDAIKKGALFWYYVKEDREYYRLITSMFLHSDFGHLLNNMMVLFFVGDNLERAAGKIKYLLIYFGSGIIAGISSIGYNMIRKSEIMSIGASGAIFGIVGAMVYILLVNKGRLEDISSRQIILFAVFSLYGGIINVNVDNVAHIGGFIGGIILAIILYRKHKRTGLKKREEY